MNPIHSSTQSQKKTQTPPTFQVESALFSHSEQDSSHAFFAPLHYEPKYAYPLLIWLHGPGLNDERQLVRIMPAISMRNYTAAAPRGFSREGAEGLDWPQDPQSIEFATHRVFDCIAAAQERFNIAAKRVFLGGFDSGGTMAFRIGLNHPESFAGVLSCGGALPRGHQPLGRLVAARSLPAFLALGRDSDVYGPERACEDLRLLHTAGVSVTLRQYPCGHELGEQMLRDVDRWVMEQITAPTETPDYL